jgi:capsular exopolysaccharide synthesis family protein
MRKSFVTHFDPKSNNAESYRVLRTNIQFSNVDKELKSIIITSAGPGEGKTTNVCNIANSFAQAGHRTLLVDADMRKPRIHRIFNESAAKGLSLAITNLVQYRDYIHKSEISNLDVMFSGPIPPNPAELLNSNNFKALLEILEKEYDYIFFDTPPASPFTDAIVLSTVCDAVLLVVSSGMVDKEVIKYSISLFNNVKANILGVVLNNLDTGSMTNYNYYYYNYLYRYNYGDDLTEKERKKLRRRRKKASYYSYARTPNEEKQKEFLEFLNKDSEENKE